MEIEIIEKKNNPLFNRTEVYFTINHEGEGTPNREIIRTEIADKLNVKKENIIINNIHSSFGVQISKGYAKIYTNPKNAESLEQKYILKRNKTGEKEKKKEEEKKEPIKDSETPKVEEKKDEIEEKTEEGNINENNVKNNSEKTVKGKE